MSVEIVVDMLDASRVNLVSCTEKLSASSQGFLLHKTLSLEAPYPDIVFIIYCEVSLPPSLAGVGVSEVII